MDIVLPVKNFNDVNDSLNSLFTETEVISDFFCENCQSKQDVMKSMKLSQLPILMNLSLNRFAFDYETFERVKLIDEFKFPLELDMTPYVSEELRVSCGQDDLTYELYAVIIHRGTPHSGHYFAYVRDMNEEGNWNLQELTQLTKEPSRIINEVVKKDEELKEDGEKVKEEAEANTAVEVNTNETSKPNEEEETNNEESNTNKKGKRQKNKAKKQQNNQKQQNNNNTAGKKKNKKRKFINKEDEEHATLNFDECEYPYPYSNENLSNRWFDFNDTAINPIRVGRLQKQFKSSESAYILFYMKKSVQISPTALPEYLSNYINNKNEKIQKKRIDYEDLLNSLIITVYEPSNFKVSDLILMFRQMNLESLLIKQKKLWKILLISFN